MGHVVLRDRRQLSQDGILIVAVSVDRETGQLLAGPDVVTRGFVYVKESEALIDDARERARQTYLRSQDQHGMDWSTVKASIREDLARYLYERTKRRPMILPMILEI